MVSVVMPTYNRSEYLAESIGSVIAQTVSKWELIVVDDGSTDSSPELLAWFARKDPRIKVVTQKNSGISAARNAGIAKAKGEFIAVMDSDDIMAPDRLEKSLEKLRETKADYCWGAFLQADEHAKVFEGVEGPAELTDDGVRNNVLPPHVTVMARKECFGSLPYDPAYRVNDDQKLLQDWYLAGFKGARVSEPVMIVRYHSESTSSTRDADVRATQDRLRAEFDAARPKK